LFVDLQRVDETLKEVSRNPLPCNSDERHPLRVTNVMIAAAKALASGSTTLRWEALMNGAAARSDVFTRFAQSGRNLDECHDFFFGGIRRCIPCF